MIQMNFQNRKRLTDLENEPKVAVGKRWGRRGVWDGHVHFAVFKMDNQQGPTVWHVELSSCHVAVWMRGASGENGYMYILGRMDACIYRGGWIHVYTGEDGCMYIRGRMDACIYRGGWIHVYTGEDGYMYI